MNAIVFTYNQRIGSKKMAVTNCDGHPDHCYTWVINKSKPIRSDGVKVVYYCCSGCNALRVSWKKQKISCEDYPLPLRKANGATNVWIDEEPNYNHFCQPKKRSEVEGVESRRSMQAELASGTQESVASAIVRVEKKVLIKLAGKSKVFRQEARAAGVSNRLALSKAFGRARRKQFPLVTGFDDLLTDEKFVLRCTERGSIPEHEKYGELLLLFADDNMLIFSSDRQTYYLQKSLEIVCDGNFKFRPKEVHQVYRIFGFVKKIHSIPLVTVLLKKKDKKTYRKMWRELAKVLNANGQISLEIAHFDNEPASYRTFRHQFPNTQIKMCSFHVKQALHRQLQEKGLSIQYREQKEVQDVVRMIGALQLVPPQVWNHSLNLIRALIQDTFNLLENTATKLNELLQHAEEENASDVSHGRQPPRQQSQDAAETSAKILFAQEEFDMLLTRQADDSGFDQKLAKFLLQIGYLMGYNERSEPAQDEEEGFGESGEGSSEEENNALRNLDNPVNVSIW